MLVSILGVAVIAKIIALVLTILIGTCSFIAFGVLLKSDELIDASRAILEKLKKRFFKNKN
jgi:hypothetical protein